MKMKKNQKAEIATVLTLVLMVVGVVASVFTAGIVNKNKIATNSRAVGLPDCQINQTNCVSECGSYSLCSSSCNKKTYNYQIPDQGNTLDRICITPTQTRTPTPEYQNPCGNSKCGSGCAYSCPSPIDDKCKNKPGLEFGCYVKSTGAFYGCIGTPCDMVKGVELISKSKLDSLSTTPGYIPQCKGGSYVKKSDCEITCGEGNCRQCRLGSTTVKYECNIDYNNLPACTANKTHYFNLTNCRNNCKDGSCTACQIDGNLFSECNGSGSIIGTPTISVQAVCGKTGLVPECSSIKNTPTPVSPGHCDNNLEEECQKKTFIPKFCPPENVSGTPYPSIAKGGSVCAGEKYKVDCSSSLTSTVTNCSNGQVCREGKCVNNDLRAVSSPEPGTAGGACLNVTREVAMFQGGTCNNDSGLVCYRNNPYTEGICVTPSPIPKKIIDNQCHIKECLSPNRGVNYWYKCLNPGFGNETCGSWGYYTTEENCKNNLAQFNSENDICLKIKRNINVTVNFIGIPDYEPGHPEATLKISYGYGKNPIVAVNKTYNLNNIRRTDTFYVDAPANSKCNFIWNRRGTTWGFGRDSLPCEFNVSDGEAIINLNFNQ